MANKSFNNSNLVGLNVLACDVWASCTKVWLFNCNSNYL